MIIDSHAHYDDKRFDEDRDSVLKSMSLRGIDRIVNSTSDMESLDTSLKLTRDYEGVYTTMGIHPSVISCMDEELLTRIEILCNEKKCVAVGEVGLDYHWEKDESKREDQRYWFRRQLDLSKRVGLPVVIHSRDACEDTFEILKEAAGEGIVCDIHCFSYSPEIAKAYVDMGFYIGIGGVVTFSNAKKLRETVRQIPITSILLETDCPYLAPDPFRGERNDSTNLPYVVREIARLKGTTEDDVINVTKENAEKFFSF